MGVCCFGSQDLRCSERQGLLSPVGESRAIAGPSWQRERRCASLETPQRFAVGEGSLTALGIVLSSFARGQSHIGLTLSIRATRCSPCPSRVYRSTLSRNTRALCRCTQVSPRERVRCPRGRSLKLATRPRRSPAGLQIRRRVFARCNEAADLAAEQSTLRQSYRRRGKVSRRCRRALDDALKLLTLRHVYGLCGKAAYIAVKLETSLYSLPTLR